VSPRLAVPFPDAPPDVHPPAPRARRAAAARLPAVEVRVETQGMVQPLAADGSGGGRRLLDALRELAPDVVVLSRDLSDAEAIRVLRALRAAGCRAAITLERRSGARPRAVTPVVAHVAPRGAVEPNESAGVGAAAAAGPAGDAPAPAADAPLRARYGLSAREVVVARLVASGATNREIAAALDLSPFTARNHTSRVLRKLGARNRARVAALLGG
jgi:DNA-binding NarL/FixJ family response regulator